MEIASRHHLRTDVANRLREEIEALFGVSLEGETFEAVTFAETDREVVLVDDEPMIVRLDVGPVLTVRGANMLSPTRRVVVVDAGAVAFVSDGADIMRPGIVNADEAIAPGDPVLVAEETHGKILAVGISRTGGEDMLGEHGKVIDTIHHVGDDLYGFAG